MRRMYSVQELSEIVSVVVGEKIEDGSFDEVVAGAVDDYLTEHPVDITALEGLDISVGSLDADGLVTGAEIVEKMSGYSASFVATMTNGTITPIYLGVCKNGNKLTCVAFFSVNWSGTPAGSNNICYITLPQDVYDKLYPYTISGQDNVLECKPVTIHKGVTSFSSEVLEVFKTTSNRIGMALIMPNGITENEDYFTRFEVTFLLSENLAE